MLKTMTKAVVRSQRKPAGRTRLNDESKVHVLCRNFETQEFLTQKGALMTEKVHASR